MIPRRKRLSVVYVHDVRLTLFKARQTSPVATTLHAKAARDPRSKAFRAGELPNEVYLFVWVVSF